MPSEGLFERLPTHAAAVPAAPSVSALRNVSSCRRRLEGLQLMRKSSGDVQATSNAPRHRDRSSKGEAKFEKGFRPQMRMPPTLPLVLALGFLYGCAPTAQSSSTAQATEPDCSFRAATSCWTLAARFPPRPAEPTDSQPGEILKPPPAVLASGADSARGSR
jgi:hypothetical protein